MSGAFPPLPAFGSLSSLLEWERQRLETVARVRDVLGKEPERAPLESETLGEERCQGYLRRQLRFRVEADDWCPAYLLIPDSLSGRGAAVLCAHQTVQQGKREVVGLEGRPQLAYGEWLAREGFVVLAPDEITAGERWDRRFPAYDTKPFYERRPEWSAMGKMLWDHQRALDFLQALELVDPARLAVMGHSLGGHNAVFLAALDERVRAAVSSCGWQPFWADENPLRWAREAWFIYMPRLGPYLVEGREPPFQFSEVIALIAPRAFLDLSGGGDTCFAHSDRCEEELRQAARIYELYGARQQLDWLLHDQGHSLPPAAWQRALHFLRSHT